MKKRKLNYPTGVFLIAFVILSSSCKNEILVTGKSTTNIDFWESIEGIEISDFSSKDSIDVTISLDNKQQVIDGFGGCFNELGWEELSKLSVEDREKIIHDLFDSEEGCKFNLCRMPIGANDYALDWYSHNEHSGDLEMKHFSIDRDRQRLIPYIKAAQKYAPNLKVWASPWCPPTWMKTNNHYACRSAEVNNLSPDRAGKEMETQFRMEPKILDAYALYFSKFVESYKSEGINIETIHVQNEPNSCQNFPSCVWRPEDLATFIGKHLGPHFKKKKLATDIFLGTIERPQIERISPILDDPDAKKYVKGVGFQWGGKGAIPDVHKKYPEMRLIQTETECGNGSNDWAAAEHTWNQILHYFNNGANAYMYWNMVLNETGKSRWGWKQNSMITIDNSQGTITYNPEFYLMKHLSYFIQPGAVKLATSSKFDNLLTFENPDKSLVLVMYNQEKSSKQLKIKLDNHLLDITMKSNSFNTFMVKL